LSQERGKLEASVFLPPASTVDVCLDKYDALVRWHEAGFRRKPVLVSRASALTSDVVKRLGYPLWLRARRGAGGLLSCLASTPEEAHHWVLFHWEHGLKTDFVAEEYLPGRDFCFMSLWRNGSLVTSMVRERLSWVGNRTIGTGGTSKLNRVVHLDEVNRKAVESIKAIDKNPHGIFCVDLKEDREQTPRPTEVNCRFTTNVHYLTLASIRLARPEFNFPWLAARIATGEDVPQCKTMNALPANLWFTKNTDMGFTMVEDEKWRATYFT
jgi:carbamoyl-phosphate synthase large subunit